MPTTCPFSILGTIEKKKFQSHGCHYHSTVGRLNIQLRLAFRYFFLSFNSSSLLRNNEPWQHLWQVADNCITTVVTFARVVLGKTVNHVPSVPCNTHNTQPGTSLLMASYPGDFYCPCKQLEKSSCRTSLLNSDWRVLLYSWWRMGLLPKICYC